MTQAIAEIVAEAQRLMATGKLAEAEGNLRGAAADLLPAEPVLWFTLAHCLGAQKKYSAAEDIYRDLLRFFPTHLETLHHLGNIVADQGRIEEAVRLFGLHPLKGSKI